MEKKTSKKCSRTLSLLLGGGLYDSRIKNRTRGLRCTRFTNPTVKSGKEIEKDILVYKKDINFVKNFIMSLKGRNRIYRIIPPAPNPNYEESRNAIREFFSQPAKTYICYWFGHGDPETGNWCFNKKMISLMEFLEIWTSSLGFRGGHLILILDTCHSYRWVNQIQSNVNYDIGRVSIQCGCLGDQESFVDRESSYPRSLLMKKICSPKMIWAFEHQSPRFWISESAMKFSREIEGLHGEKKRFVQPGFSFITIEKNWRDEKFKVSFYNENNKFIEEVQKKRYKDGTIC